MAFVQKIKPKHNPNIYATLQLFLVFIKKKPFQILILKMSIVNQMKTY